MLAVVVGKELLLEILERSVFDTLADIVDQTHYKTLVVDGTEGV